MSKTLRSFALLALLSPALAGEKMTPGPAWRTDFKAARREALRSGKPLFLYFTKTY